MALLTDLQRWRDKLLEARLSGVRRVRDQNGEEIEYRSDRELASALEAANRAIAEATGARPILTAKFTTSKGL